ncbi:hypothetical protein K7432_006596 [Basidiobolus ranarum]|uniref:Uncharacterized protein n=1 Tax=Basidiobolus ranarum TaxID=34480 RepID=A0ABR2W1T3_9FUNG
MNFRHLLLFWIFKISLVWCQITEIVRENAYSLDDGRTIWNVAKRDPTIWAAGIDITQPAVTDRLNAASQNDTVFVFDQNRTAIFSKDVPKVVEDRDSQWVSLPNGDLGYFYVGFGTRTLYLQIFTAKGDLKAGPIAYQDVFCFSAVASTQPVDGSNYITVALVANQIANPTLHVMVLNPDGSQVSDTTLDTASFDVTSLNHKIYITSAADGSFLLTWPDKTRDNYKAIRAAYYKPGQLVSKPFIVVSASVNSLSFLSITKCDSMKIGDGYYCIYDEVTQVANSYARTPYIAVFTTSGSMYIPPNALATNATTVATFQGTIGTGLPYGGLLLAPSGTTLLYNANWKLQTFDNQGFILSNPNIVLPNNTVISVVKQTNAQPGDWMIGSAWKATTLNPTKLFTESKYGNNPAILSASPALAGQVPVNTDSIKINFSKENFRNGFGNITIYDADYPQYPRQFITIVPGTANIGNTYTTKVARYAFNTPNTNYYITVDGGAFQSNIEEPLMGIRKGIWAFKTGAATDTSDKSDIVLQIRILNAIVATSDTGAVSRQLATELAQILPIESERISVRHLRSDGSSGDIYQITLKRLRGSGKQTASSLAQDLQSMVSDQSASSGLLVGTTTLAIDRGFGAVVEENVFSSNKWALIGILCGIVVIIVAYIVMCRRFPDSDNIMLIVLAISLFDFFSDLFFIVMNSGDVPSLRVPSIIFFIVPFAFNMVASTAIIVKEVSTNSSFHEWFSRRTLVTSAVSVLSATNPYLLHLLKSKFAAISDLDAPMSENVSKWILYCTAVDIIVEDIPQLVIQTMYKTHNGFFKLAPFLSLVSSCLGIVISIISHVYTHLAHKNGPKNIARKGTDFSGSHFQINDTVEHKRSVHQ